MLGTSYEGFMNEWRMMPNSIESFNAIDRGYILMTKVMPGSINVLVRLAWHSLMKKRYGAYQQSINDGMGNDEN